MPERFVYADNAGTTAMSETALNAMLPFLTERYGNPSGIYSKGRDAKKGLEEARATVAACLGADPAEIYFTGGGSEADNWALKGAAENRGKKGRHLITSAIEHHAVTHTCEWLAKRGFDTTYLPVDELGRLHPETLSAALREDTILVSVMAANNEIGTIEPIRELAEAAHARGALFHTDAVQAVGHIPMDVRELGVDMLSLAGHKFQGPKGVGALYIRKNLFLPPFVHGGGQERLRRAGTENVAGAAGLAAALREATDHMAENMAYVSALRDRLIAGLLTLPKTRLTGDPERRLPGTASFLFDGIEGESMVLFLDQAGICASSGSACTSGSLEASHVLLAIGTQHKDAHGSLRLTINEQNSPEDIDYILKVLPPIVERLRAMSPEWGG